MKPCPMCNGDAKQGTCAKKGYRYQCVICGLQTAWYQDEEEAVRAWNTRFQERSMFVKTNTLNVFIREVEDAVKRLGVAIREARGEK